MLRHVGLVAGAAGAERVGEDVAQLLQSVGGLITDGEIIVLGAGKGTQPRDQLGVGVGHR